MCWKRGAKKEFKTSRDFVMKYIGKFRKKPTIFNLILCGMVTLGLLKLGMEVPQNPKVQTVQECNCSREFFYNLSVSVFPRKRLNSTCSDEGSLYTPGQKVVSLSMAIMNRNDTERIQLYKEGIAENLKRMKKYYPGSTMRLYSDVNLEPGSDYCRFICHNPELHWCDVRRTPSLGDVSDMFLMTWRFLPLGDPTVDYFLSRDLDSVIIERQVAAVNEWLLNSSKPFHVMRDNIVHGAPILGGLWGARNPLLGMEEAQRLRETIIQKAKRSKSYNDDQSILDNVIVAEKKMDILAFDSYFCNMFAGLTAEVRPFPIKRKDNESDFAGNVNLGREKYKYLAKCPEECRPPYGKDWEYC